MVLVSRPGGYIPLAQLARALVHTWIQGSGVQSPGWDHHLLSTPGYHIGAVTRIVRAHKWNKAVNIAESRALLPTPNLGNELTFIKNKRGWSVISVRYKQRFLSAGWGDISLWLIWQKRWLWSSMDPSVMGWNPGLEKSFAFHPKLSHCCRIRGS